MLPEFKKMAKYFDHAGLVNCPSLKIEQRFVIFCFFLLKIYGILLRVHKMCVGHVKKKFRFFNLSRFVTDDLPL